MELLLPSLVYTLNIYIIAYAITLKPTLRNNTLKRHLLIRDTYARKKRANSTSDALEEYIKGLFAGTFVYI